MSDFEMRREQSVHKQRRAESGPQGDDHFEALAFDCAEALHVRVIDHTHRLGQTFLKHGREIEAPQLFRAEIWRCDYLAVTHDARETHRYVVEAGERFHQLDESVDQVFRLAGMRCLHAKPLGQHFAFEVEYRRLEPGASDVNRKDARVGSRLSLIGCCLCWSLLCRCH